MGFFKVILLGLFSFGIEAWCWFLRYVYEYFFTGLYRLSFGICICLRVPIFP